MIVALRLEYMYVCLSHISAGINLLFTQRSGLPFRIGAELKHGNKCARGS